MAKSFYNNSDPFAYHPFLMLMPVKAKLAKLETLSNSLYARLEKVQLAKSDLSTNPETLKSMESELNMLRQVLDWVNPRKSHE
jgi:hypothetical protein